MKIDATETGQRFNRMTVVLPIGRKALVLCDCGAVQMVYAAALRSERKKSCGCFNRDLAAARMKAVAQQAWNAGKFDRAKAAARAQELRNMNAGTPANGKSAKGADNHNALWWAVKSPRGHLVEGKNLQEIVRANAHLFDPSDVDWTKNRYGTDMRCNATRGLYSLFGAGKRSGKSWKGWTPIERREAPLLA